MPYRELLKIFEDRRSKMVHILNNRNDLNLGKQHQVYGAIREIDFIIKTLNYRQSQNITPDGDNYSLTDLTRIRQS